MNTVHTLTSDLVVSARKDIVQRSERMLHVFSFVPTDKLQWSPAPTARSAAHIVAHCAVVCDFVTDAIMGNLPVVMPTVEGFFNAQALKEQALVAHEDVAHALTDAVTRVSEAIATITDENIHTMVATPFGAMPMRFLMVLAQEQLVGHTAQIEYLQTIWGDMDNYLT